MHLRAAINRACSADWRRFMMKRTSNAAAERVLRSVTVPRVAPPGIIVIVRCKRCQRGEEHEIPHGSTVGYRYHGCRCDDCTAAARASAAKFRQANPDSGRAADRRWKQAHPDKVTEKRRKYRRKNGSRIAAKRTEKIREFDAGRETRTGRWTADEVEYLRQSEETIEQQARHLGRTYRSVVSKRRYLD